MSTTRRNGSAGSGNAPSLSHSASASPSSANVINTRRPVLRSQDMIYTALTHDPSPRAVKVGSKTSASAPSSASGTPRTSSRRYSGYLDHHYQQQQQQYHADVILNNSSCSSSSIPLPSYVTTYRSRESSPRTPTRMVTSSSSPSSAVAHYVNGDGGFASYPQTPGRQRHRSSPEFLPLYSVHFSEPPYFALPGPASVTAPMPVDPLGRRRDPSPSLAGVRHAPVAVLSRPQGQGPWSGSGTVQGRRTSQRLSHGGSSGQGSETSVSPSSSDETASSSATVTTMRMVGDGVGGVEEGRSTEVGLGVGKEGGMWMMEGSFSSDEGYTWHSALTCYLCDQLFRRPRILPCGHTFCSDCLVQLKDEILKEDTKMSPTGGHADCLMEGRGRRRPGAEGSPKRQQQKQNTVEVGAQLVCPMPECHQSLRLLNLGRWTIRNKTVTEAVTALRRTYESRQDACTQTDISLDSILVTLPRSLLQHSGLVAEGSSRNRGGLLRRTPSCSLVDGMVHRAVSMDGLSRHYYIPRDHVSWRSYLAMLGMHIFQQVLQ